MSLRGMNAPQANIHYSSFGNTVSTRSMWS